MRLTIQNNDQAVSAVRHLLGFEPRESLVVVPVTGGGAPVARLDLPKSAIEEREVTATLRETYGAGRWGRPCILIVCYSADPKSTDLFSRELQRALEGVGIAVVRRLAAGENSWIDFTAGTSGPRMAEAQNLIDAEAAFVGRPTPRNSREDLAAEFVGDPDLIAAAIPGAHVGRDQSTCELERRYCQAVVEQYQCSGERIQLGDAARLLVNLEHDPELFLRLAGTIRTSNALEWLPLWKDLTRHAPDEVRVAPACLAALAAWCAGDGARAWSALDRLPEGMTANHPVAPIAHLLRESLRTAAHPRTWDKICDQAMTTDRASKTASPSRSPRPSRAPRPEGGRPGLAI